MILNTYHLSLDCEIEDNRDFHKDGKYFKYENLTKCKV